MTERLNGFYAEASRLSDEAEAIWRQEIREGAEWHRKNRLGHPPSLADAAYILRHHGYELMVISDGTMEIHPVKAPA